MAAETNIEWCDATFNPWIGCTRVSPACDDCYAARSTPARTRGIQWGAGNARQRTTADNWTLPIRWNAAEFMQCAQCRWRGDQNAWRKLGAARCCKRPLLEPARRRVFCASLADWLDNEVPIEWFVDLLDLIRRTPQLDKLMLTKRIGNWFARMEQAQNYIHAKWPPIDAEPLSHWIGAWLEGYPPADVWIGATVVNQPELERDAPKLLDVPARVRFLSIEPMLGAMQFPREWLTGHYKGSPYNDAFGQQYHHIESGPAISWIIAGGESGPEARPIHPAWLCSLRDQCAAADVPFLFKQWGAWMPDKLAHEIGLIPIEQRHPFGLCQPAMARAPKAMTGRILDGREHLEWPA
jgi:protein gp37